jgi:hypothetical protein
MKFSSRPLLALGVLAFGLLTSARAVTINFGPNLEAADTYLGTSHGVGPGMPNTEAETAAYINHFAGTTFVAGDILKVGQPIPGEGIPNANDDQFAVPGGYMWLVVKYGGPGGGYGALFLLNGNDALVPYDSAALFGNNDQYAVSHYGLAGPVNPNIPGVPDGGTTVALLGLGLVAVSLFARRKNS